MADMHRGKNYVPTLERGNDKKHITLNQTCLVCWAKKTHHCDKQWWAITILTRRQVDLPRMPWSMAVSGFSV